MNRLCIKALAAIALVGLALGSGAFAPRPDPDYADLTLKQPAPKPEYIIDDVVWDCQANTCHAAPVTGMPPLWSCKRIVRETGAVESFIWRGQALNAADIAACNTRARS